MATEYNMIPLNDTRPQYEALKEEVQAAINGVLEKSWFVMGENVRAFEQEFAEFCGVKHAIGVSNGTDAIHIAMRALGIGPDAEVILPTHTATFSALGVSMTGARPKLIDVEFSTGNIDAWVVEKLITEKTKAIMPVHLYGHAADMDMILKAGADHNIPVVEDAAQAHGATYKGKMVGSIGKIGCFSFYPTKNLGAYGDGGAVTTDDDELAEIMRELRNGGQRNRYEHVRMGFCNRLDELQAAILRVKLRYLQSWNAARAERAAYYNKLFTAAGTPVKPMYIEDFGKSVYHLYVIRTPVGTRDGLMEYLKQAGIASYIHYPVPVHLQEAYAWLGYQKGAFPNAEDLASVIVTLPMYPELPFEDIERIVKAVSDFYS